MKVIPLITATKRTGMIKFYRFDLEELGRCFSTFRDSCSCFCSSATKIALVDVTKYLVFGMVSVCLLCKEQIL